MSGSVLIVDHDIPRRASLAQRLQQRYFRSVEVGDRAEAEAALSVGGLSLVLVATDDDDGVGEALCRSIKDGFGDDMPVMAYAIKDQGDARRVQLRGGVDDALILPQDDVLLLARISCLMRLQATENELRMRAASSLELGVEEKTFSASDDLPAEILLVAPRSTEAEALAHHLEEQNAVRCSIAETGFEAMRQVERSTIDAIIVSGATSLNGGESGFAERENPIDLIRALSSVEAGRHAAMIFVADATEPVSAEADAGRLARALDAGAADCAFVDREWDDLAARLRTHLKRKRSADRLRASLDDEMKNAVIDPLTGLHNRRYLNAHFARRFAWARENETPLAALMFDLDRFKSINDMHGHAVGDEALIAFAKVLRNELRVGDLVSRYGGEEFVVVMPGATLAQAAAAAERVRAKVAELRHDCSPRFGMTVSVGVASINQTDEAPEDLLRRADGALSAAKSRGRDCVDRA